VRQRTGGKALFGGHGACRRVSRVPGLGDPKPPPNHSWTLARRQCLPPGDGPQRQHVGGRRTGSRPFRATTWDTDNKRPNRVGRPLKPRSAVWIAAHANSWPSRTSGSLPSTGPIDLKEGQRLRAMVTQIEMAPGNLPWRLDNSPPAGVREELLEDRVGSKTRSSARRRDRRHCLPELTELRGRAFSVSRDEQGRKLGAAG